MTPTPYRIRVMGPPDVQGPDGDRRALPAGKPLALLYYLLRHPDGVDRDRLAAILWSDRDRSRALHSLRQALWRIRNELDEEVLTRGEPVALRPGRVTSDVAAFEVALAAGDLETADRLWRSPPFQHLTIRGEPRWDRWADAESLRVERLYATALRDAATRALDAGHADRAARWAGHAIQVLPSSADARDLLVEALLSQGDLAAARRALEAARAQAAGDAARLEQIAELEDRTEAMATELEASRDPQGADDYFVGRSDHHARLLSQWRQAREGDARLAVIHGPPGSGRRSLAGPVRAAARSDGAREVHIRLPADNRSVRWSTLHELARGLLPLSGAAGVSHASDRILSALVPSRAAPGSGDDSSIELLLAEPVLLADALRDLLDAVTDDRPLLVTIEDLDRADEMSWAVLRLVLRDLSDLPLLVILTDRTTGPGRGRSRVLDALGDEPHVVPVGVDRWSGADLEALLDHRYGRPGDRWIGDRKALVEYLEQKADGDPCSTLLLLEGLEGDLDPAAPLSDPASKGGSLPESVRERLNAELSALDPAACRVAARLARGRGPVHPDDLFERAASSTTPSRDALDELLDHGILRWVGPYRDRIDFATPMLREVAETRTACVVSPERSTPGGEWVRPAMIAAAVIGFLVLGGFGAIQMIAPGTGDAAEEPGLWGSIVVVDPLHGEGWRVDPDSDGVAAMERLDPPTIRPGSVYQDVYIGPDGSVHWFVSERASDEKPWIARYGPDGVHTVHRTEGDDFLLEVSPDGRWALVASERLEAEQYRRDLYRVPLGMGDGPGDEVGGEAGGAMDGGAGPRTEGPVLLVEAETRVISATVSPDGRRIAAVREGDPDSLLVLTPRGDRVLSVPSEVPIRRLEWCGGAPGIEPWLVAVLDAPAGARLHRLEPGAGVLEPLPELGFVAERLTCGPRGERLVYHAALEGELTLVLHDFRTDERTAVMELDAPIHMRWLPGSPPATPVSLDVAQPDRPLEWGEVARLNPVLERVDGSTEPAHGVEWSSEDPSVATVSRSGELHANGPGETMVGAVWDGWLERSIRVVVESEAPEGMLVFDELSTLDPERWIQVGSPPSRIVERGGEPVLLLAGDAMYRDGVMMRRAQDLPRGGTAEIEFRLELTRSDKQWFLLCLVEGELPDEEARSVDYTAIRKDQLLCARYPIGDFASMRDDGIEFLGGMALGRLTADAADHLPSSSWTHLALQLRPDGDLSIWINREPVFNAPLRVRDAPDARWRVLLIGASHETEVLVRNLRLWDGVRYR